MLPKEATRESFHAPNTPASPCFSWHSTLENLPFLLFAHRGVGKMLLDNKADLNAQTKKGVTPLMFAADKGHA